ncbi:hypothetical protein C461_07954 [Halorubrum aidingense JCM 13560]|uniref:DUF63 domain-containing protein n=1 Tax=Halorubrum aidingense JCM 13560 TaxID=1230454 RepID=M0PDP2_9EURY|nr:DUF63 family protein [Halorubrum aidingense]EMA67644.1 hypothetical protein C461_07954 [Halorubrum aidingense JCM 13560]
MAVALAALAALAAPATLPFLPAGTTLPPAPYLLAVLLVAGVVAVVLRRRPPTVTDRHVLALTPWVILGSAAHVLYVIDALPPLVRPLAGSPTVYLTVGALAGASWLAADATDAEAADATNAEAAAAADGRGAERDPAGSGVPRALAAVGTLALVPVVAVAVAAGISTDGAFWSAVSLAAAVPIAALVWTGLTRARPETGITGGVGALAVFGHALDGASTAVGTTQLGFGERTPLSRLILEIEGLPAVPVFGEGWLFVLVKLAVASLVVWLFTPYVRDEPAEGYLLLGFIAAVGLGPAAHNLLLFSVVA